MFSAGMPQIDFYRCTPEKWVRGLTNGGEASLPDPTNVLWVLLDSRRRSAAEAFPGAHTAAEWYTASCDDFAAGLWNVYERAWLARRLTIMKDPIIWEGSLK